MVSRVKEIDLYCYVQLRVDVHYAYLQSDAELGCTLQAYFYLLDCQSSLNDIRPIPNQGNMTK